MARIDLLDNVFWHCFAGPHRHLSEGTDTARRYARGISPIIAFVEPHTPDFDAIAPYCAVGEQFFIDGWQGRESPGFRIEVETTMNKMVWDAAGPDADPAPDAIALAPEHAARCVELTTLTKPGPFGPRTLELGEYYGLFDGERLMAMAGERTCATGLREISGVCTHPDFQGRGLAKRLMLKLIRRQLLRGETPFLHVRSANEGAIALYRNMGFRDYRVTPLRVVERVA